MDIYVGNMSYRLQEQELHELFTTYGPVTSVKLVTDKETGKPRGFGFISMENDKNALDAIAQLHGAIIYGRNLVVNQAKKPTLNQNRPKVQRLEGQKYRSKSPFQEQQTYASQRTHAFAAEVHG